MSDIKTAAQIETYTKEVMALIQTVQELYKEADANEFEPRLTYELGICENVLEQIKIDQSKDQREYLTSEYFLCGSFTLPSIRSQAKRAITQHNKMLELTTA